MQKFTIIVGILTVCIIAIIAEVLTNGYSFLNDDLKTDVLMVSGEEYPIEELLFGEDAGPATGFDFSLISEEDLRDAGLKDFALQKVGFDGYLFEKIDLTEFTDLNVLKLKLIDKSLDIPTIVGAIYQIDLGEEALSKEMYRIIKQKASARGVYEINETGRYGDDSFFLNDDLRIGTAFLLVKSGEKVYAFTYPKVRHENIKKLIEKLHG